MRVGDQYESEQGRRLTVKSLNPLVVEVERTYRDKDDGRPVLKINEREVSNEVLPFLLKGYKKVK